MEPTVGEGKIIELELDEEVCLALDMPRKPEEAKMSFTIDSIFRPFLGKMVKITIEETKE